MASIRRHGRKWRVEVYAQGRRRSKVLPTRQEARDWAARQEYELTHRDEVAAATKLGEVMLRYSREVSPTKRGARWETIRLERLQRDPLARVQLGDLRPADLADWRDRRLAEVAPASVRREMNLLGAVLTQARREWGLIARNPLEDVRRPAPPAPRRRLPSKEEFERLALVAGSDLSNATARAYHAFLFSCETAMRAGEIVGLRWKDIDLEARVADLPRAKNGVARQVPLTREAVTLLEALPRLEPVFGLTSANLDALWRKIRGKAAIEGLNFHDARAYACTQLSRRVDVMTLARISGHRDLSMLLNTYYRESAADVARRLD